VPVNSGSVASLTISPAPRVGVADAERGKDLLQACGEAELPTEAGDVGPGIQAVGGNAGALEPVGMLPERPLPQAVRACGHFPTEQAAMKTLCLVTRSIDPEGTGQTRWGVGWKPALNAFAITLADRMPAATRNHER
jgi:hypothetical protein